jgi:hypothetical protein
LRDEVVSDAAILFVWPNHELAFEIGRSASPLRVHGTFMWP